MPTKGTVRWQSVMRVEISFPHFLENDSYIILLIGPEY